MDYKNARDAVWQILIKYKISSLPVSVGKICMAEGFRVISYKKGERLIRKLGIENTRNGNDAFTVGGIIFYDDSKPITRQRFSVAHELGHILLHDVDRATVFNREPSPDDDPLEHEANIFASRLLAPLCVLQGIGVQSAAEIAEICNISITAANVRWERLCKIRERDRDMRSRTGRGTFLMSPLERKVYENFFDYIEKNRY